MEFYFFQLILIVLWSCIYLFTYLPKKICDKIYLGISFTQMALIAGLRSRNVGTDTTITYEPMFNAIQMLTLQDGLTYHRDYGFFLINKFVLLFTHDFYVFNLIISFLVMYGFAFFIYRQSNNVVISTFLFFTLFHLCDFMNTMRQYISIMILCNAIIFLKNRKILYYLITVFVASMIHLSSAVMLIMPLFSIMKKSMKNFIFFTSIASLLIIGLVYYIADFLQIFFPSYLSFYGGTDYLRETDIQIYIAMPICQYFLSLIGIFIWNQYKDEDIKNNDNLYFYSMFIFYSALIGTLLFQMPILRRIVFYFSIYLCVFLPELVRYTKFKYCLYLIMMTLTTIYFFMKLPIQNQVVPYEVFFNSL